MPFGLTNAPSTFQRTIDMTSAEMRHFTAVYMDDIVVYSASWAEHLQNLRTVIQRLREKKFYVKRSKCEFATEEIDFVGFRVSARWYGHSPE